jgi:hypothetical protein
MYVLTGAECFGLILAEFVFYRPNRPFRRKEFHVRHVLAVAFLGVLFVCGIWDVFQASRGAPEDSVSQTVFYWSIQYPVLPLILGILLGHLFWPQQVVRINP